MPAPRKYPLELRERAVRMYRTAEPKTVIRRMAEELGVHHEALRNWIRQAEADAGERDDLLTTAEREELAALRKENAQLKRANEVLLTQVVLGWAADVQGLAAALGAPGCKDRFDQLPASIGQVTRIRAVFSHVLHVPPGAARAQACDAENRSKADVLSQLGMRQSQDIFRPARHRRRALNLQHCAGF